MPDWDVIATRRDRNTHPPEENFTTTIDLLGMMQQLHVVFHHQRINHFHLAKARLLKDTHKKSCGVSEIVQVR